MSLVKLNQAVKTFGSLRAVDDVSFSIDRGEVVGFLGPNGAGKTTTMRLITAILEPDSGSVEVSGVPVGENSLEVKRQIGYLPESNPLYTDMLVSEYLEYIGQLRDLPPAERRAGIDYAVGQTALEDVFYRPIDELSKGYRQRVGLAQAILSQPDILILDEPTEGLDPNQRVEIRRLITELGQEHTVILSTHVMQEVQATCNRIIIINRGRIIADGAADVILAGGEHGTRISLELTGARADSAAAVLEGLEAVSAVEVESEGRTGDGEDGTGRVRLTVFGIRGEDPRAEIFKTAGERGWTLWELHLERESLEDVFREMTAKR
jgi:ABC-2 type transport system ATP-binding protein